MKVTYYSAVSLDGYIAKTSGDVAWLDELGIAMEETGYDEFFASVDAIVMGRHTYDFVYNYGSWPYGDKPAWVCTNRPLDVVAGCNQLSVAQPDVVMQEAEAMGIEHLWLAGGGQLAASFLQQRSLTHLSLQQMPIILGAGIRLFGNLEKSVRIKMQSVEAKPSGFAQLDYEVVYD